MNEKEENLLRMAEKLSSAMITAEAAGADFSSVEEPWQDLTAAIQKYYERGQS